MKKRMRLPYTFSIILTLLMFLSSSFSALNAKIFAASPDAVCIGVEPGLQKRKFRVVLDAGHGGNDPGKPSKEGFKESEIALKIVLELGKQLSKNPEIEVIYTRKTDIFIELDERGAIANRAEADLFVSVHCNAHTSQAYGTETYVLGLHANKENLRVAQAENSVIFLEKDYDVKYKDYNLNSTESIITLGLMQEEFLDQSLLIASMVQDNFRKKLKRKDRSVKQAGFVVLHQTTMPSILVETGFITNKKEGRYLNSKNGQRAIAGALANAITSYKEKVFVPDATEVYSDEIITTEADQIVDGVTFKVQLAASSRKLDAKSYNFKGLKDISRRKDGKLYKYYSGSTSNYTFIKKRLAQAKAKGYSSAFIVSFNNDNIKVPLPKVLN